MWGVHLFCLSIVKLLKLKQTIIHLKNEISCMENQNNSTELSNFEVNLQTCLSISSPFSYAKKQEQNKQTTTTKKPNKQKHQSNKENKKDYRDFI